MPPWHRQNEGSNGVVGGKVRHCVTVQAGIRNEVAGKAAISKIGTPNAICVGHISQTEALEGQPRVNFIPTSAQSLRNSPNRTIPDTFPGWVGVVADITHMAQTQRLWRLSASWMYRSKPLSFPCCRNHITVSTAQSGQIPTCISRVMVSIKSLLIN